MAPIPQSAYNGEWNSETETYVLPPLVGLPFSEMVKNGMGYKHRGDTRYYRLIVVHGFFAALAFLVLIPSAIIFARFLLHGRNPRVAMWGHIGLNFAAMVSLTITFVAGYIAVGRKNFGWNPHHLIGVALYAAVLLQGLFGCFVRMRNQKKIRKRVALHAMLHHWFGRGIFLLGLTQIPLGLYLYGSPLVLFVLYAVFVFLVFLAWFVCEYLRTRGYFTHGMIRASRPAPEMAEGSGPVDDTPYQDGRYSTEVNQPRSGPGRVRGSIWSNLFKRQSSPKGGGGGPPVGYATDVTRGTSLDTSRAPSGIHSPAPGGLHAPPGRQNHVPPVPNLPANFGGEQMPLPGGEVDPREIHRDNGDRYLTGPGLVRDTVLRDSTTLGIGTNGPSRIDMPRSPASPPYTVTPVASGSAGQLGSAHTSDISGVSSGYGKSYPVAMPPYHSSPHRREDMPSSPIAGGGYMEADNGFVHGPTPHAGPPVVPLPMPPEPRRQQQQQHRRDRSSESVGRLPTRHSTEYLTTDNRGGDGSLDRRNSRKKDAQVSVQVRVNPDGKSVTVRRVPPDENERDRRERARLRAERAAQREASLDRERQHRRTNSARRSSDRPATSGSATHAPVPIPAPVPVPMPIPMPAAPTSSVGPESSVGGYTPSAGAQSSTIAGASGGLLGGGIPPPRTWAPPPEPKPLVMPYPLSGGISPSQRGSVVSATGTAENSELEQELAKDYRRKKRREERTGNIGNPVNSDGEIEWT